MVEGKRANRTSFTTGLMKKDFEVHSVPNGNEAVDFVQVEKPQLVIVDASSLRTGGKRICSAIHKKIPQVPIILIVDEGCNGSKYKDVNEVLVLPFTLQKLLNRIKPFLERQDGAILEAGPIKLDLLQRWVSCNGKDERLTPRLFILLKTLMQKPGKPIEREELFKKIWETNYVGDMRSLDVHVSWLRKAIEKDPRNPELIKTQRGVGYYLDIPETPIKK